MIFYYYNIFFKDINECSGNTANCNQNATCTNTQGYFTCRCIIGYSGNGIGDNGCQGKITFFQIAPIKGFHLSYYCNIYCTICSYRQTGLPLYGCLRDKPQSC